MVEYTYLMNNDVMVYPHHPHHISYIIYILYMHENECVISTGAFRFLVVVCIRQAICQPNPHTSRAGTGPKPFIKQSESI